ncbi:MAG: M23 family metallopeptidase [Pseudomonadales bacterium]|jgi:hypothetical protein|nr:M23 family metallopeptidase [Pseudomonadales bacterium]
MKNIFSSKKKKSSKKVTIVQDFGEYLGFLGRYTKSRIYAPFSQFESGKDVLVGALYKKRGKYSRPLMHLITIGLVFVVIIVGPFVLDQGGGHMPIAYGSRVLSAAGPDEISFYTIQAEAVRQFRGGQVVNHVVTEGETLASIAAMYNLYTTTIAWENDIAENATVTEGQVLRILPVDGIRHRVARGDTIFTVARRYGLDESQAQMIVDYPFNDFLNDETFALMTGQYLMVPGGVRPRPAAAAAPVATFSVVRTPDAGTVSSTGQFIWPASGGISQGFSVFHRAIDISNRSGGPILAADSGVVTHAGWDSSGYGNRVIVDHGNGYVTLYAHLSTIAVSPGQSVNQGNVLGQMGSTGRSTGIHLHFEIRTSAGLMNPMDYLR